MSKASIIGDVVKVVADAFTSTPKPKPKGKGGRKRKPRGPKAATPQQKAAARALGININTAKALSPADLDKAIKYRLVEVKFSPPKHNLILRLEIIPRNVYVILLKRVKLRWW